MRLKLEKRVPRPDSASALLRICVDGGDWMVQDCMLSTSEVSRSNVRSARGSGLETLLAFLNTLPRTYYVIVEPRIC